jgi:hypothetical protein
MKIHLKLIFIAVLATSIIYTLSCTSISKGPHSSDEVLTTFARLAEQQTLTARDNIYSWWSERLSQGSVKYVEDENYYEVEFVSMSGVEQWGIDMESSKIWPMNQNAILSAFTMFCSGKDDASTDCQQWSNQLLNTK